MFFRCSGMGDELTEYQAGVTKASSRDYGLAGEEMELKTVPIPLTGPAPSCYSDAGNPASPQCNYNLPIAGPRMGAAKHGDLQAF